MEHLFYLLTEAEMDLCLKPIPETERELPWPEVAALFATGMGASTEGEITREPEVASSLRSSQ